MIAPKKRGHHGKPGLILTGQTAKKPSKRTPLKHRILLVKQFDGQFHWVYFIGTRPRSASFRSYSSLAHCSRSARTFRELLANADYCEIVPPVGHVYSGG